MHVMKKGLSLVCRIWRK